MRYFCDSTRSLVKLAPAPFKSLRLMFAAVEVNEVLFVFGYFASVPAILSDSMQHGSAVCVGISMAVVVCML